MCLSLLPARPLRRTACNKAAPEMGSTREALLGEVSSELRGRRGHADLLCWLVPLTSARGHCWDRPGSSLPFSYPQSSLTPLHSFDAVPQAWSYVGTAADHSLPSA